MRNYFLIPMLLMLSGLLHAESNITRFTESLSSYENFEASFKQVIRTSDNQVLQVVHGKLYSKKPGLLRWVTTHPYEQVLLVKDQTAWFYDIDLEQVSIKALSNQAESTPALLLSGDQDRILDVFEVDKVDIKEGFEHWKLLPKAEDSLFVSLLVVISEGVIQSIVIEDSLGQFTEIYFENSKINQPIDQALFSLDLPEDIDVFDERLPAQ